MPVPLVIMCVVVALMLMFFHLTVAYGYYVRMYQHLVQVRCFQLAIEQNQDLSAWIVEGKVDRHNQAIASWDVTFGFAKSMLKKVLPYVVVMVLMLIAAATQGTAQGYIFMGAGLVMVVLVGWLFVDIVKLLTIPSGLLATDDRDQEEDETDQYEAYE